MFLAQLYETVIYQPFFNILVFFYQAMDFITQGHADMGVAVIFLTILIRILLLPMSLSGDKSEKERREIAHKIKELEETFAGDPVQFKQHKQLLLRTNRKVLIGELFSLAIQVIITLMLWRIFASGLKGADFHLLYPFMPKVTEPFNLTFLGRFHLDHTMISREGFDGSVMILNLIQSFMIFVVETLSIYTSPYPPEKGEVVRLQLVLPLVSFFIFMFLPAGKKIFIITTLVFSTVITLYKYIRRRYEAYKIEQEEKAAAAAAGEVPLVVDVK